MTLQTAKYSNFFETTLDGAVGASDGTITLSAAPTSDGTTAITAPFYLVINPDSLTKREVVLVTSVSGVIATVTRDVELRHSPDPSHDDGDTVRMAVVGEMFEDLHDRINDVALTGDVTGTIDSSTQDIATTISAGAVEFAMLDGAAVVTESETITSNDNDTTVPTSAAVKDYADNAAATLTNKVLQDYAEKDVAVTSGTTLSIDLSAGNTGAVTLAHNVTTLTFTNVPTDGTSSFTLKVTQDGTGSRTMALSGTVNGSSATFKTPGAAGLTLSTGAADIDLVTFLFFDGDATNVLVNSLLDFS